MASPFSRFRKRQKTLLAFVGVFCMVAFVFGGVNCDSGGRNGGADQVVASTVYGSISEAELYNRVQSIHLVNQFLRLLKSRLLVKMIEQGQIDANMQQFFAMHLQQQLSSSGLLVEPSEQTAVDMMIMANKATEMGLVVSDNAVSQLIKQQTEDLLTQQDLDEIFHNLDAKSRTISRRVYEALKNQMLAVQYQHIFTGGLTAVEPAQRWEYYQRLNRNMQAEVVPVAVNDFIDQVKDPDPGVLEAFFDEHKDRLQTPGAPESGFKQPHRARFQYLLATYDQYLEEAKATITDEEVVEQYEKFKDIRYLFSEVPSTPTATTPSDLVAPEFPPPDDQPGTEDDDTNKPSTNPADPAPAKPSPDQTDNQTPSNKPANKPADDANQDKPSNDESDADSGGCQAPAEDDSQPNQPASAAGAAAPASPQTPASADAPDNPPTPDPAKAPATSEDNPTITQILLDYPTPRDLPRDIAGGPKPKHDPLWKVEERIRGEIAADRATKKIDELLQPIVDRLNNYAADLAVWRSRHLDGQDDPNDPRPQRPDFVALAQQYGLSAHETGIFSARQLDEKTELGQALSLRSRLDYAYQSPVFKAGTVSDVAGNQYLYWKVEDSPEHVPSLETPSVRRAVLARWKQVQARDLARKQADEFAEKARTSNEPLRQVLGEEQGDRVLDTFPFTWMTSGGGSMFGPAAPRISTIPGVQAAGEEFMQTAFNLSTDEVGVAFNGPHTVCYVIRMVRVSPLVDVLRTQFMADIPTQAAQVDGLARQSRSEVVRGFVEDVRETAGLHWNRPAAAALR